ncbi:MAG: hypothetical protein ACJ0GZ_01600 [Alphaproteobacteria bacterium]
MKLTKNILLLLSMSLVVSACSGKRNSPSELSVLKYNKLVIPKKLELVEPGSKDNYLGYKSSREIISSANTPKNSGLDIDILEKFKIRKADKDIINQINNLGDSNVVVNIKKEKIRIKQNLEQERSILEGRTPSIKVNNTRSGVDELFND